jgi:hypothetical protein
MVPVAFLYSTDAAGGNSGSPVLNSKGELVGVNFDRAFEATINDFAWNQRYSRFDSGRRSVRVMDHRRGFWYQAIGPRDALEQYG